MASCPSRRHDIDAVSAAISRQEIKKAIIDRM